MSVSRTRVLAIFRKELREYRRNGAIVWTMAIVPLVFLIQPLILVLAQPAKAATTLAHQHVLLYLLAISALVPGTLAAYAVVGERQQGTLEPILTTPIRREEFLLGKALAIFGPSIATSLAVYALFFACVVVFARPGVASAVLRGPDILGLAVFTPLLIAWSILVGIAMSARSSDIRVAQQLSVLANLPAVLLTALIAFNKVHPSLGLAVALAAVLLLINGLGWRIMSGRLDPERLVTGTR
jgi:ABC-type transport system involved in multi-copper enzyme maturation permease subunit